MMKIKITIYLQSYIGSKLQNYIKSKTLNLHWNNQKALKADSQACQVCQPSVSEDQVGRQCRILVRESTSTLPNLMRVSTSWTAPTLLSLSTLAAPRFVSSHLRLETEFETWDWVWDLRLSLRLETEFETWDIRGFKKVETDMYWSQVIFSCVNWHIR